MEELVYKIKQKHSVWQKGKSNKERFGIEKAKETSKKLSESHKGISTSLKGKTCEELNKMDIYKDKKCKICGRKYPETILNIEGYIHHNTGFICLDKKSCNRNK